MVDTVKEFFLAGSIVIAAALITYNFYVAPRDAMLNEVMTCMDGDRSRLAYDQCFEEYAEQRR